MAAKQLLLLLTFQVDGNVWLLTGLELLLRLPATQLEVLADEIALLESWTIRRQVVTVHNSIRKLLRPLTTGIVIQLMERENSENRYRGSCTLHYC